ncbi:hypothetical protein [Tsuneonella sp. HG222]
MIRATRREALAGALAVPAMGSVAHWRFQAGAVVVHDPALAAGRRLAAQSPGALAIEGDRIRFARALFARRPSLVVGVSRPADALLIEEVAREAGYVAVSAHSATLAESIAAASTIDRGLVLGWVLTAQS